MDFQKEITVGFVLNQKETKALKLIVDCFIGTQEKFGALSQHLHSL